MLFKRKQNSENPLNNIGKQNNKFFSWIMEFSKKIICITFVLYVLIHIYILTMTSILYYQTQDLQCLDTLIAEINLTFREVIGGYIIKAAVENVFKYAELVVEKWVDAKILQMQTETEQKENMIERDGLTWQK